LVAKAIEKNLSNDDHWKALLHYHHNQSTIEASNFFLDKNGNKNPQVELTATIEAFFNKDSLDDSHAICRYPARLKWLSKQLEFSPNILPKTNCLELKKHLEKTSTKDLSIAFASENVNNLISMMGHVFLKISGEKNGKKVAHSLGYFADFSKSKNPIILLRSVFSNIPGVYILEPYQKKLDEYNNHQKRSVWEYQLNFSKDQIDIFNLHIWEMRKVNAEYNFITHNCGNALLYLLYVADPELQRIYSPLDAPLDIVKNLQKENYIKDISIFPADNYKFRMIANNFSYSDRKIIKDFLQNGELESNSKQQASNLLYGAQTALNYQFLNRDIDQEKYNFLFEKIEKLSTKLPKNNLVRDVKNPLNKSDSSRIVLGYQDRGHDKNIVNFGFYPVYNSISSNNSEYFNEFELQLANIEGSFYTERQKLRLDNFDLIKIKNIINHDSLVGGLSGSFRMNMERERFDSKSNKMFPNITFGIGVGENFFSNKILFYTMANFGYSHFLNHEITYANPEVGMIFKEGNFGKITTKYTKYFSSNIYKYKEITEINQTFFIKQNNDVVISYKNTLGGLEKSFKTLAIEYQHHF